MEMVPEHLTGMSVRSLLAGSAGGLIETVHSAKVAVEETLHVGQSL